MDVLAKLKASPDYKEARHKFIGPDRSTVQHTINVLESYDVSLSTEKRIVR